MSHVQAVKCNAYISWHPTRSPVPILRLPIKALHCDDIIHFALIAATVIIGHITGVTLSEQSYRYSLHDATLDAEHGPEMIQESMAYLGNSFSSV